MPFQVLLTAGARRDLQEIVDYIAGNDSTESADRVLARLAEVVASH